MKIAVDAMGGDLAPYEIIKGSVAAAQKDTLIVLVGNAKVVTPMLKEYSSNSYISLVDAPQVIGYDDSPTKAVRRKKHSSIVAGIDLVKKGDVDAFVSAGHTGAVATAAILNLGRAKGVPRPALAAILPSVAGPVLLLDIGANSDCKPQFLAGFANLGHTYAANVLRIDSPRIGLLSNGEEANKGTKLVRSVHKLLETSKLNFVGNVEGKDLMKGEVDVVITDGFTGNAVLKTIEGFAEFIFATIRRSTETAGDEKPRDGAMDPAVQHAIASMSKKLDWSEHGGAILLGIKGNVVVAHGRSRAKAITSAIRMAKLAVDRLPPTE